VLPRLYERLCEEKPDEDDGDEADSSNLPKRHRSLTSGKRIFDVFVFNSHINLEQNMFSN
jgi:hypothetical protein